MQWHVMQIALCIFFTYSSPLNKTGYNSHLEQLCKYVTWFIYCGRDPINCLRMSCLWVSIPCHACVIQTSNWHLMVSNVKITPSFPISPTYNPFRMVIFAQPFKGHPMPSCIHNMLNVIYWLTGAMRFCVK